MTRHPESPIHRGESYPPELFLAVHRGTPGDVDFYRRACTGARSVLELGCGSGRVAAALSADGLEVVGVERDADLLARAPASAASFIEGDMRDFDVGRRFDRVLVPYNGIYCLASESDLIRCFERIRAHLAPDGLLVWDGYAADAFHESGEGGDGDWDELEEVGSARACGKAWRVFEQSRWWRDAQRLEARYVHVPEDGGAPVEAVIEQRYLLSSEVVPLAERAGLEVVALLGGFDQQAFDSEESERLIAVVRASV